MLELIALNKEVFNFIKEESKYIGIVFIAALVIFQSIYYKENFLVVLRIIASLFWLFAIPGYFAMLYWKEKLEFTERLIVGIALSAALIGIFSYYLGLMGLNMTYHAFLLPLMIIIIGLIAVMKKKASPS